jgi:hypothetical protein
MVYLVVLSGHSFSHQLLGDGDRVYGRGKLFWRQDVLQNVVSKVERARGLPLGTVLKELVQVLPVALDV